MMQYPIYIVSKGRAEVGRTWKQLRRLGITEFQVIVEADERVAYAEAVGARHILTLPPRYQQEYDPLDGFGARMAKGSGPARNFAWDHAEQRGAEWHWLLDDNLVYFGRLLKGNRRVRLTQPGEGEPLFAEVEEYCSLWRNLGMAAMADWGFAIPQHGHPRAIVNSRCYSCILIRTAAPFRWRGRYNEDTILSLDMLTKRYCTLLFYSHLMKKPSSRTIRGGQYGHHLHDGHGPQEQAAGAGLP